MKNKEWMATLSGKEFVEEAKKLFNGCTFCTIKPDALFCEESAETCREKAAEWLDAERQNELKPCPFCGKKHTLQVLREDEINPDMEDLIRAPYDYAVNCDFNDGGCGATGTYRPSKSMAIEWWNRRA